MKISSILVGRTSCSWINLLNGLDIVSFCQVKGQSGCQSKKRKENPDKSVTSLQTIWSQGESRRQKLPVIPIFYFHCSTEAEHVGGMPESAARLNTVLNTERSCVIWLHLPLQTLWLKGHSLYENCLVCRCNIVPWGQRTWFLHMKPNMRKDDSLQRLFFSPHMSSGLLSTQKPDII